MALWGAYPRGWVGSGGPVPPPGWGRARVHRGVAPAPEKSRYFWKLPSRGDYVSIFPCFLHTSGERVYFLSLTCINEKRNAPRVRVGRASWHKGIVGNFETSPPSLQTKESAMAEKSKKRTYSFNVSVTTDKPARQSDVMAEFRNLKGYVVGAFDQNQEDATILKITAQARTARSSMTHEEIFAQISEATSPTHMNAVEALRFLDHLHVQICSRMQAVQAVQAVQATLEGEERP